MSENQTDRVFSHPNRHPYNSGLTIADDQGAVQKWLVAEDPRPQWYRNRVNAGLNVLSPDVLNTEITTVKVYLDRQILKPLAGSGKCSAMTARSMLRIWERRSGINVCIILVLHGFMESSMQEIYINFPY